MKEFDGSNLKLLGFPVSEEEKQAVREYIALRIQELGLADVLLGDDAAGQQSTSVSNDDGEPQDFDYMPYSGGSTVASSGRTRGFSRRPPGRPRKHRRPKRGVESASVDGGGNYEKPIQQAVHTSRKAEESPTAGIRHRSLPAAEPLQTESAGKEMFDRLKPVSAAVEETPKTEDSTLLEDGATPEAMDRQGYYNADGSPAEASPGIASRLYHFDDYTGELVIQPSVLIPWITDPATAAVFDMTTLFMCGAFLSVGTFVTISILRWIFILRCQGSPLSLFHASTVRSWANYFFSSRDHYLYDTMPPPSIYMRNMPERYRIRDARGNYLYFVREQDGERLERGENIDVQTRFRRSTRDSEDGSTCVEEYAVPGFLDLGSRHLGVAGEQPFESKPTRVPYEKGAAMRISVPTSQRTSSREARLYHRIGSGKLLDDHQHLSPKKSRRRKSRALRREGHADEEAAFGVNFGTFKRRASGLRIHPRTSKKDDEIPLVHMPEDGLSSRIDGQRRFGYVLIDGDHGFLQDPMDDYEVPFLRPFPTDFSLGQDWEPSTTIPTMKQYPTDHTHRQKENRPEKAQGHRFFKGRTYVTRKRGLSSHQARPPDDENSSQETPSKNSYAMNDDVESYLTTQPKFPTTTSYTADGTLSSQCDITSGQTRMTTGSSNNKDGEDSTDRCGGHPVCNLANENENYILPKLSHNTSYQASTVGQQKARTVVASNAQSTAFSPSIRNGNKHQSAPGQRERPATKYQPAASKQAIIEMAKFKEIDEHRKRNHFQTETHPRTSGYAGGVIEGTDTNDESSSQHGQVHAAGGSSDTPPSLLQSKVTHPTVHFRIQSDDGGSKNPSTLGIAIAMSGDEGQQDATSASDLPTAYSVPQSAQLSPTTSQLPTAKMQMENKGNPRHIFGTMQCPDAEATSSTLTPSSSEMTPAAMARASVAIPGNAVGIGEHQLYVSTATMVKEKELEGRADESQQRGPPGYAAQFVWPPLTMEQIRGGMPWEHPYFCHLANDNSFATQPTVTYSELKRSTGVEPVAVAQAHFQQEQRDRPQHQNFRQQPGIIASNLCCELESSSITPNSTNERQYSGSGDFEDHSTQVDPRELANRRSIKAPNPFLLRPGKCISEQEKERAATESRHQYGPEAAKQANQEVLSNQERTQEQELRMRSTFMQQQQASQFQQLGPAFHMPVPGYFRQPVHPAEASLQHQPSPQQRATLARPDNEGYHAWGQQAALLPAMWPDNHADGGQQTAWMASSTNQFQHQQEVHRSTISLTPREQQAPVPKPRRRTVDFHVEEPAVRTGRSPTDERADVIYRHVNDERPSHQQGGSSYSTEPAAASQPPVQTENTRARQTIFQESNQQPRSTVHQVRLQPSPMSTSSESEPGTGQEVNFGPAYMPDFEEGQIEEDNVSMNHPWSFHLSMTRETSDQQTPEDGTEVDFEKLVDEFEEHLGKVQPAESEIVTRPPTDDGGSGGGGGRELGNVMADASGKRGQQPPSEEPTYFRTPFLRPIILKTHPPKIADMTIAGGSAVYHYGFEAAHVHERGGVSSLKVPSMMQARLVLPEGSGQSSASSSSSGPGPSQVPSPPSTVTDPTGAKRLSTMTLDHQQSEAVPSTVVEDDDEPMLYAPSQPRLSPTEILDEGETVTGPATFTSVRDTIAIFEAARSKTQNTDEAEQTHLLPTRRPSSPPEQSRFPVQKKEVKQGDKRKSVGFIGATPKASEDETMQEQQPSHKADKGASSSITFTEEVKLSASKSQHVSMGLLPATAESFISTSTNTSDDSATKFEEPPDGRVERVAPVSRQTYIPPPPALFPSMSSPSSSPSFAFAAPTPESSALLPIGSSQPVATSTSFIDRLEDLEDNRRRSSPSGIRSSKVFVEAKDGVTSSMIQCPAVPSLQLSRLNATDVSVSIGTVYQPSTGPPLGTSVDFLERNYEPDKYLISYEEITPYEGEPDILGSPHRLGFKGQAPSKTSLVVTMDGENNKGTGMKSMTERALTPPSPYTLDLDDHHQDGGAGSASEQVTLSKPKNANSDYFASNDPTSTARSHVAGRIEGHHHLGNATIIAELARHIQKTPEAPTAVDDDIKNSSKRPSDCAGVDENIGSQTSLQSPARDQHEGAIMTSPRIPSSDIDDISAECGLNQKADRDKNSEVTENRCLQDPHHQQQKPSSRVSVSPSARTKEGVNPSAAGQQGLSHKAEIGKAGISDDKVNEKRLSPASVSPKSGGGKDNKPSRIPVRKSHQDSAPQQK